MKHYYLFLILLSTTALTAQYQEGNLVRHDLYENASDLYSKAIYGPAISQFKSFIEYNRSSYVQEDSPQLKEAEKNILLSQIRLNTSAAIPAAETYIGKNYPDLSTKELIQEVAKNYYNDKRYVEAISYYDKLSAFNLSTTDYSEVVFKRGYCHFVLKQFNEAETYFRQTKEIRNIYYYPSNYYYGMVEYFNQDYDAAINSFQRLKGSTKYKGKIPYYITQIYFTQGKLDQLISYGEAQIILPEAEKKTEIRLLLGQSYFKKNQFNTALEHLEYYEANTPQLTAEEFYQLAFTQYKLGQCEKAIDNFLELNKLDSNMGQVVNYYLADCYMKTNDKQSARSAFKRTSQMSYEPSMQEEALYNYGKLSSELGFDREAINTLIGIKKGSPYFIDAQGIVSEIFVYTQDYENAIKLIDNIEEKTPKLKETYQKVNLFRGIQLFNDGNVPLAQEYFENSLKYPLNAKLEARSKYWIAYSYQDLGNLNESIDRFEEFFILANGRKDLPENESVALAHYNQAFNYFKQRKYEDAKFHFERTSGLLEKQSEVIQNTKIKEDLLADTYIRTGDSYFKDNKYQQALNNYDKAITIGTIGVPYAHFQKGMIYGLQSRPYDKLLSLEEITSSHKQSAYADDAFYQIGETYISLGKKQEAAYAFQQLVNNYESKSRLVNKSLLKLGLLSYNLGNLDNALNYYKQVLRNNPSASESNQSLIAIEEIYVEDLKSSEEYLGFLETVPGIELNAFSRDSISYQIAANLFDNTNYEDAIGAFDSYLKKYNKGFYRLDAHYKRGESHLYKRAYNRALKDYEIIIKEGYNDYFIESLRKAALISYNHEQNFSKAYKYYDELADNTQDATIRYEAMSGALQSAFRISKSDGVYKYANAISQDTTASKEDLANAAYYLGKTSYTQKKYDQAIAAFNKVIRYSNNNQAAESSYLVAKIFFEKGDFVNAEKQANLTTTNHGQYPAYVARSLMILSDIYIIKDDVFNARAALEAILENFNNDEDILTETRQKLALVTEIEEDQNRIKVRDSNTLELDESGN